MDATPAALETARAAIGAAIAELTEFEVRTETLADFRPAHRTLLIPRPPSFANGVPVWRLGVLLLGADGSLFATAAVTRARDPKHPNFTSVSGEERRMLREAARKAGYGTHDTVNYDAPRLPFDETLGTTGPLVVRDGELTVSWNASRTPSSLRPFDGYLRERVELAAHPPEGAGETERES